MASNKNQAFIDFLLTCPYVVDNPLFFNFGKAVAENRQIITNANDKSVNVTFIDGSVRRRIVFTLIDYKSVAYRALIQSGTDENMEYVLAVQNSLDWVTEQNKLHNYPDFGEDCVIDNMEVVTDQPNLNGVDTSTTPPLAKYSISIKIDYIDYSEVIWK